MSMNEIMETLREITHPVQTLSRPITEEDSFVDKVLETYLIEKEDRDEQ